MLSPVDIYDVLEQALESLDLKKGEDFTDKDVHEMLELWGSNINLADLWREYVREEGDGTL